MHEEAGKNQHEKGDEKNRQHKMVSRKPCPQNGELTLEQAEGRRAGDRKRHHKKCGSGQGHRMDQPAFRLPEKIGVQMLLDISGTKEEQRLGHRMKGHVQKHAQDTQRPSEAECQHHDPAVVNARIGQQAPEVLLHEDEGDGHSHGEQPEQNQELRAKLRAQAFRTQNVEPHQTVESAVEHPGGEHRCPGDRRFTIGIRLPGMHGSDAGLGSVSEKNKDEGQPHGRLVKLGGVSGEDGPVQTRKRVRTEGPIGGIVGQNRAEQGHGKDQRPR